MELLSSTNKRTRSNTTTTPVVPDLHAVSLQTNNPRRLSRLHWGDLIICKSVTKEAAHSEHEWWGDKFSSVVSELSLKLTHFNKTSVYCIDVSILCATLHEQIESGHQSLVNLEWLFTHNEGFSVHFVGTKDTNLTIPWNQLIYSSRNIMLFDSPLPHNKAYNELFENKDTINAICRVFRCVSLETAGDYAKQ